MKGTIPSRDKLRGLIFNRGAPLGVAALLVAALLALGLPTSLSPASAEEGLQLQPGDEVIIYTNVRAYTYVVQQQQVVGPLQVEVMAQTPDPVVTLISCYPYMVDTHRIVISAALLEQ